MVLHRDSPDSRRLFLGTGVLLVGANDPRGDRLEIVRGIGAGIPEGRLGQRSLRFDIEPGQCHGETVAITTHLVHRDLQRRGRSFSPSTGDTYPIPIDLLEFDRLEPGCYVGPKVRG